MIDVILNLTGKEDFPGKSEGERERGKREKKREREERKRERKRQIFKRLIVSWREERGE